MNSKKSNIPSMYNSFGIALIVAFHICSLTWGFTYLEGDELDEAWSAFEEYTEEVPIVVDQGKQSQKASEEKSSELEEMSKNTLNQGSQKELAEVSQDEEEWFDFRQAAPTSSKKGSPAKTKDSKEAQVANDQRVKTESSEVKIASPSEESWMHFEASEQQPVSLDKSKKPAKPKDFFFTKENSSSSTENPMKVSGSECSDEGWCGFEVAEQPQEQKEKHLTSNASESSAEVGSSKAKPPGMVRATTASIPEETKEPESSSFAAFGSSKSAQTVTKSQEEQIEATSEVTTRSDKDISQLSFDQKRKFIDSISRDSSSESQTFESQETHKEEAQVQNPFEEGDKAWQAFDTQEKSRSFSSGDKDQQALDLQEKKHELSRINESKQALEAQEKSQELSTDSNEGWQVLELSQTEPLPSKEEVIKRLEEIKSKAEPMLNEEGDYRLRVGDSIRVSIYGEQGTERTLTIDAYGEISYLLVGRIQAAGFTINEFTELINKEMKKQLQFALVNVVPVEFGGVSYTILGQVRDPGRKTLMGHTTVLDAIAQANGMSIGFFRGQTQDLADLQHAFLARRGQYVPIDFRQLIIEGDMRENIVLEDGDYIFIPSSLTRHIYVVGEVNLPANIGYLNRETLSGAIAKAGGVNEDASAYAYVVRGSLSCPKTMRVHLKGLFRGGVKDMLLQPGDIIYVPRRDSIFGENLVYSALSAFVAGFFNVGGDETFIKIEPKAIGTDFDSGLIGPP